MNLLSYFLSKHYVILFCILILSACNFSNNNTLHQNITNEIINEYILVECIILQPVSFYEEIISNGRIYAYRKAELRFKTQGNLEKVNYQNGQWVNAGSIISCLDNRAEEIQINNAKNQIYKAKLELSSLMLGYGGNAIDTTSVPDNIYRNLEVQSGYTQAKNQLQTAYLQYDHTIIKAPFSGIITNIEAQAHNMISAGDIFCYLLDNSKYVVEFPVIENELVLIKAGQKVRVIPFAFDDIILEGYISEINPSVDDHGLVRVKALVPGNIKNVFDGMNVKIFIEKEVKNQLVIPKEALVLRSNKEVVFTFEKGLAKWNYVSVANENSTSYLISAGLNAGDSVIVSGNLNLAHDARVRIKEQ